MYVTLKVFPQSHLIGCPVRLDGIPTSPFYELCYYHSPVQGLILLIVGCSLVKVAIINYVDITELV